MFIAATALPAGLSMPHTLVRGDEIRTLDTIRSLNPHIDRGEPLNLSLKVWALSRGHYEFFRGTADIFYQWCNDHCADWMNAQQPRVLLHGDIHLGNIGTYQSLGAPGEDIHFGVVDLDEVFEGPAQLDLLRAAATLRFLAIDTRLPVNNVEWPKVIDRLCTSYETALRDDGNAAADHAVAQSLLAEARSAKCSKYLMKYCDPKAKRFLPVRLKKGKAADIMQRVDDAERERVVAAVRSYLNTSNAHTKQALAPDNDGPVVLDAVRWTRLDSSGSQSLRKYLVLLEAQSPACDGLLILQLKEEPISAAARAKLIPTAPPDQRAAFVAGAYARLLRPAKWMIGHTRIGSTGFLVKTKDPWGEEPSTKMFKGAGGMNDAAELLGTTLGRAHHHAIAALPDAGAQLERVAAGIDRAALTSRSEAVTVHLIAMYRDLQKDADAQTHIARATAYFERVAKENDQ